VKNKFCGETALEKIFIAQIAHNIYKVFVNIYKIYFKYIINIFGS